VPSELTLTDPAVLERCGNPPVMPAAGHARLTELLLAASRRGAVRPTAPTPGCGPPRPP